MASKYAQHVGTKSTPQTEAIPGREAEMKSNNAGGVTFTVDKWKHLDRFLVLGAEGGTYYVGERKLTQENAQNVVACIKEDGARTVRRIVEVSDAGRAPKNDPAIFALALAASVGDDATKREAFAVMPKVCRIGTHLFQFAEACDALRGWGKGLRNAISNWYGSKRPDDLAYQVVKYQSRNKWSHRDLLRKSHAAIDGESASILRWVIGGKDALGDRVVKGTEGPRKDGTLKATYKDGTPLKERQYSSVGALPSIIEAFEEAKKADAVRTCALIREHNLPRECVRTDLLNDASVWEALLEKMPMTAMIRNLGNLSKCGLLKPLSAASKKVVAELGDVDRLKKARVHPLGLLIAMKTYSQGHGMKGSGQWIVDPEVVAALDAAFYTAFDAIEPTNKRWFFGLDVSGSMSSPIAGLPISSAEAAAAFAMASMRTEPYTFAGGFSDTFKPLPFTNRASLATVLEKTSGMAFSTTDCSLPMLYALQNKIEADVFCVITDNETYRNPHIHPCQALVKYRNKTGIDAKLVVVATTATPFTIADPKDAGMLDVVGLDTSVPAVVADFVRE